MKKVLLLILILAAAPAAFGQVLVSGYQGDWEGSTVHDCKYTTNVTALGVSVPTTLAGSPVIKVYKDQATGTETATGVTHVEDFDMITGLNDVAIDTSNAFYSAGSDFSVVVTQGTLGGTSIAGTVLCSFSVLFRPSDLQYIDGLATNGNNATLNLKHVSVVSGDGNPAVNMESTDSVAGLQVKGGDASNVGALSIIGLNSTMTHNTGIGLRIQSGTNLIMGDQTAPAVSIEGGSDGTGPRGGNGLFIKAGGGNDALSSGSAVLIEGHDGGIGLDIHGGDGSGMLASGPAISLWGGEPDAGLGAPGLSISNEGGAPTVLIAPNAGDTDAIQLIPSGTGVGLRGSGLAVARGIAYPNFQFKLVRASDNRTPVTGATVTAQIMKDGATFAAVAGSAVEDTLGWYHVPLSATEMTADEIVLRFVGAAGTVTSNVVEYKIHTNP